MLGKTIARLRKSRGLTQAKFAEEIHVTQAAVSQWETGRTNPDVQQLFILADFFGITVEDLSSGSFVSTPIVKEPKKEISPAETRAEAKLILEQLTDEQYEAALAMLKLLPVDNKGETQ